MTALIVAMAIGIGPPSTAGNANQGQGEINMRRCSPVHCISRRTRYRWRRVVRPFRGWLRSTRYCESGNAGLYRANTGNGFYGGYQFTIKSWRAVGGRGFPHEATSLEQDYRAVLLRRVQGVGAWPRCGH